MGEVLSKCTCIHVGAETIDAACLAMIRAWPGMDTRPNIYGRQDAILILPLPQENTNAEA